MGNTPRQSALKNSSKKREHDRSKKKFRRVDWKSIILSTPNNPTVETNTPCSDVNLQEHTLCNPKNSLSAKRAWAMSGFLATSSAAAIWASLSSPSPKSLVHSLSPTPGMIVDATVQYFFFLILVWGENTSLTQFVYIFSLLKFRC